MASAALIIYGKSMTFGTRAVHPGGFCVDQTVSYQQKIMVVSLWSWVEEANLMKQLQRWNCWAIAFFFLE